MKYNSAGLNRLVRRLGMQVEAERLMYMGLTYSQLAEVFDSMFNPDLKTSLKISLLKGSYEDKKSYKVFPPKERYKLFQFYFGIGTSEIINEQRKSEAITQICQDRGNVQYKRQKLVDFLHFIGDDPKSKSRFYKPRGFVKRELYNRALEKILESSETTRST